MYIKNNTIQPISSTTNNPQSSIQKKRQRQQQIQRQKQRQDDIAHCWQSKYNTNNYGSVGNQNNMRFVVEDDKQYGDVGNRSIFDSIPQIINQMHKLQKKPKYKQNQSYNPYSNTSNTKYDNTYNHKHNNDNHSYNHNHKSNNNNEQKCQTKINILNVQYNIMTLQTDQICRKTVKYYKQGVIKQQKSNTKFLISKIKQMQQHQQLLPSKKQQQLQIKEKQIQIQISILNEQKQQKQEIYGNYLQLQNKEQQQQQHNQQQQQVLALAQQVQAYHQSQQQQQQQQQYQQQQQQQSQSISKQNCQQQHKQQNKQQQHIHNNQTPKHTQQNPQTQNINKQIIKKTRYFDTDSSSQQNQQNIQQILNNNNNTNTYRKQKIKCYRCNKYGHTARICSQKQILKCIYCLGNHRNVDCIDLICMRCNNRINIDSQCKCNNTYTNDILQCNRCRQLGHIDKNCGKILCINTNNTNNNIYNNIHNNRTDYAYDSNSEDSDFNINEIQQQQYQYNHNNKYDYNQQQLGKVKCLKCNQYGHFNCHNYVKQIPNIYMANLRVLRKERKDKINCFK